MARALLVTAALVGAIAVGSPRTLAAQETIASDRPGIGSGSYVLGRGIAQLETGIGYARADDLDTYSIGQALVRVGTPAVELEVFVNSWVVARADLPGLDFDGFQDLGVGVKLPLVRGEGPVALSLQGVLVTPTGSDELTGDTWAPGVNALMDAALTDRAVLSLNVGVQHTGDDDLVSLILTPSLALGGGLGAYAGYAGLFADAADSHFAEGGLTYLANPDVQLDLNGGYDVESDAWFLGVGLAARRGGR